MHIYIVFLPSHVFCEFLLFQACLLRPSRGEVLLQLRDRGSLWARVSFGKALVWKTWFVYFFQVGWICFSCFNMFNRSCRRRVIYKRIHWWCLTSVPLADLYLQLLKKQTKSIDLCFVRPSQLPGVCLYNRNSWNGASQSCTKAPASAFSGVHATAPRWPGHSGGRFFQKTSATRKMRRRPINYVMLIDFVNVLWHCEFSFGARLLW